MSEKPYMDDQALDNRPETVPKQLPGYFATQQVNSDVVAEQRRHSFKLNWVLYKLLNFLEILLGLRFILKLLGANPNTSFSSLIYRITEVFIAPLKTSLGTPTFGNSTIEVNTLITMVGYALFAWIVEGLIATLTDCSNVRTATDSAQEYPPPIIPRL
jgi:YggT family protein